VSQHRLVLASASPRRRDLLASVGLEFDVVVPMVDESQVCGEPCDIAQQLALDKANDVVGRVSDATIIAADTIVVVDGHVLGKPVDHNDSYRMLRMLCGNTHTVVTGVVVMDPLRDKTLVCCEESTVHMRELEDDEIWTYIRTGEPSDKAGSYAIQGIGAVIVDRIEGCYSNVVGLPLARVALMLKQVGISILG
jgi:septum formation protein